MKNISKKLSNSRIIAVLLLALGTVCLYPGETFEISERRAAYFIIRKDNADRIKIGSRGNIFDNSSKTPVGTFKVIDVYKSECLCLIESLAPGINSEDTRLVSFIYVNEKVPQIGSTSLKPGPGRIIVCGIRFTQLSNNTEYYLSNEPFPVQKIEPLNISGIKNILYKIEKETNNRFSADLVSLERINRLRLNRRFNLTDKNKIFLGVKAGKIGMIYEEGYALQHMEISSDTLLKFKETMFFYIMLRKK